MLADREEGQPGRSRRARLIALGGGAAVLAVALAVVLTWGGRPASPPPETDPRLLGALGGEPLDRRVALAQDGDVESLRKLLYASTDTALPPELRQAVNERLHADFGLEAVPQLVAIYASDRSSAAVPDLLRQLARPDSEPAVTQWFVAQQALDSWARNPAYWPGRGGRGSPFSLSDAIGNALQDFFSRDSGPATSPFSQPEYRNALARLTPLLVHDDPVVQFMAAGLLDRYGGLVSREGTEVQPLLTSPQPAIREFTLRALDRPGKPELPWERPPLIQALDDPEPRVRGAAAFVLGRRLANQTGSDPTKLTPALLQEYGGDRLVAGLAGLVQSGRKYDRSMAASLLGDLGAPARPAVPALHQALKHSDEVLQSSAAVALARIAPEDETAMPQVLAWLDLPPQEPVWLGPGHYRQVDHRSTVSGAISCLGYRGRHAAPHVPRMAQMLETTQEIRWQLELCRALARIGPDARPAVPSLQRLADTTTDHDLRKLARESVGKIEANP